jgi:hypothetical protein
MSLLAEFLVITQDWRRVFPQQRTFWRGVRQALGSLVSDLHYLDQRRPEP